MTTLKKLKNAYYTSSTPPIQKGIFSFLSDDDIKKKVGVGQNALKYRHFFSHSFSLNNKKYRLNIKIPQNSPCTSAIFLYCDHIICFPKIDINF